MEGGKIIMDNEEFIDEIQIILFGEKQEILDNLLMEKILEEIRNLKGNMNFLNKIQRR